MAVVCKAVAKGLLRSAKLLGEVTGKSIYHTVVYSALAVDEGLRVVADVIGLLAGHAPRYSLASLLRGGRDARQYLPIVSGCGLVLMSIGEVIGLVANGVGTACSL